MFFLSSKTAACAALAILFVVLAVARPTFSAPVRSVGPPAAVRVDIDSAQPNAALSADHNERDAAGYTQNEFLQNQESPPGQAARRSYSSGSTSTSPRDLKAKDAAELLYLDGRARANERRLAPTRTSETTYPIRRRTVVLPSQQNYLEQRNEVRSVQIEKPTPIPSAFDSRVSGPNQPGWFSANIIVGKPAIPLRGQASPLAPQVPWPTPAFVANPDNNQHGAKRPGPQDGGGV